MITLKKLFIPILCVVVFSLTSCLKDDDSDTYTFVPLTQQEKSEQIQKMQGNYKGKKVVENKDAEQASFFLEFVFLI